MTFRTTILLIALWGISSCSYSPSSSPAEETPDPAFDDPASAQFYQHLRDLCGMSFAGHQVYVQEGRESWEQEEMVITFSLCQDDVLHIPFGVGENTSRTWMFFNEEGLLRFRHDHRHADGSPEDLTLYGGYADVEASTSLRQVFPADAYTLEIHPRSQDAVWVVELSEDLSTFSYQLHHRGALLFQADFDLNRPLK